MHDIPESKKKPLDPLPPVCAKFAEGIEFKPTVNGPTITLISLIRRCMASWLFAMVDKSSRLRRLWFTVLLHWAYSCDRRTAS